ncbi:hypothetical protein CRUP_023335 [Coryphaenoides rupestris]|nr:hypothetical protein CRUP_023335 [Coryphaenoides rupestris]
MLKSGDPSGSAFLKVDPSYLHHWQQVFPQTPQTLQTPQNPQTQLKTPGPLAALCPPQSVSVPAESLRASRLNNQLISSTHCSSSSSSSSSALTPSSSSLAGLSQLPLPQQIALFGQALAPTCSGTGGGVVVVPPDPQGLHPDPQGLHPGGGVVSSSVKSSSDPKPLSSSSCSSTSSSWSSWSSWL